MRKKIETFERGKIYRTISIDFELYGNETYECNILKDETSRISCIDTIVKNILKDEILGAMKYDVSIIK